MLIFKKSANQPFPTPIYKKVFRFLPQNQTTITKLIHEIAARMKKQASIVSVKGNCINFSGVSQDQIVNRHSMLKSDSLGLISIDQSDSTIEYQLSLRKKLIPGVIFICIAVAAPLVGGFPPIASLFLPIPALVFTFAIPFSEVAGVNSFVKHAIRESGLELKE